MRSGDEALAPCDPAEQPATDDWRTVHGPDDGNALPVATPEAPLHGRARAQRSPPVTPAALVGGTPLPGGGMACVEGMHDASPTDVCMTEGNW